MPLSDCLDLSVIDPVQCSDTITTAHCSISLYTTALIWVTSMSGSAVWEWSACIVFTGKQPSRLLDLQSRSFTPSPFDVARLVMWSVHDIEDVGTLLDCLQGCLFGQAADITAEKWTAKNCSRCDA